MLKPIGLVALGIVVAMIATGNLKASCADTPLTRTCTLDTPYKSWSYNWFK